MCELPLRSSFASICDMVKAMDFPSGEHCGSLTFLNFAISSSLNGRLDWASNRVEPVRMSRIVRFSMGLVYIEARRYISLAVNHVCWIQSDHETDRMDRHRLSLGDSARA